MKTFLARFGSEIKGVLSGFDRLRLRGTIRWLSSLRGLGTYLNSHRILLKDFRSWAMGLTDEIQTATEQLAVQHGRQLIYLSSSSERKETRATEIAKADGVTEGLIAVFKCVEPCHTFKVGPNASPKRLELRQGPGRCSHLYFYVQSPKYGPFSLRLQTWLPFTIHICLNGREWLARQLTTEGIAYEQRDNCFVDIADISRAQDLVTEQLRTNWDSFLGRIVKQWHPAHASLFPEPLDYYWSGEETEWATDVMFQSREALAKVYPRFLHHAMTTFGSVDVLRFLGRRPAAKVHGNFIGEVLTTLKTRPEGTRVKHSVNRNSLKMYDKQEQVLRVETTINNPRDMKVFRRKENNPRGGKSWQRLRKGVADLHRRAEISQGANERYLESLAAVDESASLREVVQKVCEPTEWQGKRVRALQPLSKGDGALLSAVTRSEFAINGFRNRELLEVLNGATSSDPTTAKREAARITRQLRLLRGHGLIRRIPKTHRYQLTDSGRTTITSLLVAQQTSIKQLAQLAA